MFGNMKSTRSSLIIAWVMSLFATLASIYFIEIVGNPAGVLCWVERMLIFSIFLVLTVGILRNDTNVKYYAAPMLFLGGISALFQQLVHWEIIGTTSTICNESFVCTTKFFDLFGVITQATLCLTAFVVVAICLSRSRK